MLERSQRRRVGSCSMIRPVAQSLCERVLLVHVGFVAWYCPTERRDEVKRGGQRKERDDSTRRATSPSAFNCSFQFSTSSAMASTSTSTAEPLANPRGIPKSIFLVSLSPQLSAQLSLSSRSLTASSTLLQQENVEDFVGGPDGDAEESLQSLQQVLACVSTLLSLTLSCSPRRWANQGSN